MSAPLVETAQALGSLAAIVVALTIIGKAAMGAHRLARRVEDTNELVQKELNANGGSSLRDSVDRIEAKADRAVSEAESAAVEARNAAASAAKALDRIESIEARRPSAVAIAVNPPMPEQDPAA